MITFEFHTQRFNEELRKRVARSKQTLPAIVNRVAYSVAYQAYKHTRIADTAAIDRLTGATKLQVVGKRGKLLKRTRLWTAANRPLFAGFIRRIRNKDPRSLFASRSAFDDAMHRDFARRHSAPHFLRSTWAACARKLAAAAKTSTDVRTKGPPASRATDAKPGWSPMAILENYFTQKMKDTDPRTQKKAHELLGAALRLGMRAEYRSMAKYAREHFRKDWKH